MMNIEEAVANVADKPIEAHASPVPDQAWSGVRSVLMAVSAFALGRGWIQGDTATLLAAVVGVAGPFVIGQLKIRRRSTELATVAAHPATPSDVAVLKRP